MISQRKISWMRALSWTWLIKIMIHDKIQNCSIDKTKIMMIEKNRAKRGGPQKMFFSSVKSPTLEVFFIADKEYFLSIPIIRSLCNWLANCCLVDLIDVTLACEGLNPTWCCYVADVDAMECVEDSLVRHGICHKCHLCKTFLGSGKIFKN